MFGKHEESPIQGAKTLVSVCSAPCRLTGTPARISASGLQLSLLRPRLHHLPLCVFVSLCVSVFDFFFVSLCLCVSSVFLCYCFSLSVYISFSLISLYPCVSVFLIFLSLSFSISLSASVPLLPLIFLSQWSAPHSSTSPRGILLRQVCLQIRGLSLQFSWTFQVNQVIAKFHTLCNKRSGSRGPRKSHSKGYGGAQALRLR